MKQLIRHIFRTLVLLTIQTVFAQAQIVTIPDSVFKATLVNDVHININLDTEIQVSEAAAFTDTIYANFKGIADLTGIEAFTNVTVIEVVNNNLTSINLTSNTALKTLACQNNHLTSLDLSANTALEDIQCFGNQLSSLNISTCTPLYQLNCSNNQLTLLDVSNNPNLAMLYCQYNQLSILNVSANTNLYAFFCNNNLLTSLDISVNTTLSYFYCNYNLLSNLNIKNGNNSNFSQFDARFNTNLSCIQVDNATYMNTNWASYKDAAAGYSEDCSCMVTIPDANFKTYLLGNAAINTNSDGFIQCAEAIAFTGTINVDGLGIANLTGIEAFVNINKLFCENNPLMSIDVSANTALIDLRCYQNQLSNLDVSANTSLINLFCGDNQLTSLNISTNTALTKLDFSNNAVTSLDITANTNLTTLYFSHNNLTSLNTGTNTVLTDIDASYNSITAFDFSSNTALTNINCPGNQLSSLNLTANTSLTSLYCGLNHLTSLDVSSNTNLTTLTCGDNLLTSLDVSLNTSLTIFECSNNQLTSLNVNNGNNDNFIYYNSLNNPNLYCIQVDNASAANTMWHTTKDTIAGFSLNCSCVIHIPDNAFRNALVTNPSININYDGIISCGEAAAYNGSISVPNLTIADLTGIEAFTALTSLDCNNNPLSSLNVSANTALTFLNCYSNQLTSLDVSANTALTTLHCYSNQLTSLNVSANTALVDLQCYYNQLTSLNVSGATALTSLYCPGNQLTSLDVSTNTALTYVECENNQLTSLDVSANTALAYLDCKSNLLTSLNVSGATALTTLYCQANQIASLDVSACTALRGLQCGNNLLTSLDVFANTQIADLECESNQLTYLHVSANPTLVFFTCISNPLTCILVDTVSYMNAHWANAKDATAGYSTDCSCTVNIPDANFRNYLLNDTTINANKDGVIQCAEATAYTGKLDISQQNIANLTGIEAFTALTKLFCWGNSLNSLNVSANTALTRLYCNGNQLTSLDISTNTALISLICNSNQLTNLDVSANTALTNLDCYQNQLTTLDVSANTNLTSLNCGYNQLTSIDVTANSALASLDCNDNYTLSSLLTSNPSLTHLNCASAALPSIDVSADVALTSFSCNYNSLTNLDVSLNTALTTLTCTYNQLTSLNLASNTALTTLGLEFNQITSLNLTNNLALQTLDCSNGPLASLDVSANTALTTLLCSGTQLSMLNVQNGNNVNLTTFSATSNPNLSCIMVDDTTYSNANWAAGKDASASFSANCACLTPVNAGADVTLCSGKSATLTASNAISYSWSNSITTNSNAVSPSITTTYFVTGTDGYACNTTDTVVVTVNISPVVSISGDSIFCDGSSTMLTASGAITYTWLPFFTYGATISMAPPLGIPYAITLNGTDINGCVGTAHITVTSVSIPTVNAGVDQTTCSTTVNLAGNSPLVGVGSWSIIAGAGAASNYLDSNTAITGLSIGTNTFIWTNTIGSCSNSDTVSVIANPLPTVYAGADQIICGGGTLNLTGSGASTYVWDNGVTDGIAFTPLNSNTYVVIGTDINSCTNSDTIVVTVNSPTVSISGTTTICLGSTTSLIANGATMYSWSNGGMSIVNTVAPVTNTTYYVQGTANGCSAIDSILVTVNPNPLVNFTTNGSCTGAPVNFTDLSSISSGTIANYIWDFGDGTTNSLQNTTHTYALSGNYSPSLTVTSALSCTSTFGQAISIGLPYLSGTVTYDSLGTILPLQAGTVSVFNTDSVGALVSMSTVNVVNGAYQITLQGLVHYTILSTPDSATYYPNLYTMYDNHTTAWDSIIVYQPATCLDSTYKNIVHPYLPTNLGGTGIISGYIYNPYGGRRPGEPVIGVDVSIDQVPGGMQAMRQTDTTGYFEFTEVPDGFYRILVNIPGLPMDSSYFITLDNNSGLVNDSDNIYFVNDTTIYIDYGLATGGVVKEVSSKVINSKLNVYPNPFSTNTTINFSIVEEQRMKLEVVDLLGQTILIEDNQNLKAGTYYYTLDAEKMNLKLGVYFVRLNCNNKQEQIKMVVK